MNHVTKIQTDWQNGSARRSKATRKMTVPEQDKMPACVPVSNGVGDINANQKPPTPAKSSESKLSKIITCLFWRKKTDVVDMTKDTPDVAKKQKLTVDRSDRSRRVLKMESMRTAPTTRDDSDAGTASSQSSTQMFLPSENPTDPTVRRACSEVIRTSSSPSNNKPMTREAFTDGKKTITTRNTNYRGQRAGGTLPRDGNREGLGKPPKPPERHHSSVRDKTKPIVVPGVTSSSDDDIGYDSDNDITDLHDEIRRMNISQPELRNSSGNESGQRRASKGRRREGSISLSEDEGDTDNNDVIDDDRPRNPLPGNRSRDTREHLVIPNEERVHDKQKSKSMEEVIDDLFKQTQCNIDSIYRNGLESMDIETYRSDTVTPDTCMKRLEEDLMRSPADHLRSPTDKKSTPTKTNNNTTKVVKNGPVEQMNNPEMANLLNEVSIWAHDRQQWLLEDSRLKPSEGNTRESTVASLSFEGKAIAEVSRSNGDNGKCSNWISDQRKLSDGSEVSKINGLLTGPKLFRSTSKSPRNVSFGSADKDMPNSKQSSDNHSVSKHSTRAETGRIGANKDIQILDMNTDSDVTSVFKSDDKSSVFPEPWTADMYTATSKCENDRSTLNDNLSELDEKVGFRARSPGSWLSSNGSCSNLMVNHVNPNSARDCFEVPRGKNETPEYFTATPDIITDSTNNVIRAGGKSHQILRQAPKVHTPFLGAEKFVVPVPTTPAIPNRPLHKNTQLKPISSMRTSNTKAELNHFPSLPGMRGASHSFMSARNMNEYENSLGGQVIRPFSEIPLTTTGSSSGVPQGPDASHPYIQAMMRPLSETTTNKRGGKIGMGPIMATQDRQTYARDIINAIEKQRLQPQQDAFHINIPTPVPEGTPDGEMDNSKPKPEPTKKRHKVFNNNLIRGGYNYDKHSRKNSQSFSERHNSGEPPQLTHSVSFQGGPSGTNPATTSVSDLSFSMRDSSAGYGNPISGDRHNPIPKQVYDQRLMNGNYMDFSQTQQTKPGNDCANVSRNNSLQTHSLGSSVQNYGTDGAQTSAANHQTAEKFRKMRSRRDQEMEWLMKDAAETEV